MFYGGKIDRIAIQLEMLLDQINTELLKRLQNPSAVAPHRQADDPLLSQLYTWRIRLEQLERALTHIGSGLRRREQAMYSVPRQHRWQERQSIASRTDSLARANGLAEIAKARLLELLCSLLIPGEVERINTTFDLAEDTLKTLDELLDKTYGNGALTKSELTELRAEIAAKMPGQQHFLKAQGVPGTDWVLTLTVLIRLAHILVLKRAGKERGA